MFSLSQQISGKSSPDIAALQQKTLLTFGMGVLIILSTLILHSYPQYEKSKELKADIIKSEIAVTELKSTLAKVERELQKSEAEYKVVLENSKAILDKVFPLGDHTDQIVEFIEEFALHYDSTKHPLEIESISFSKPIKADGYDILPFRTNVTADKYNFDRLMMMIEKSGSLKKEDFFKKEIPVPIMSIQDVNVSFPDEDNFDPASRVGEDPSRSTAVQEFSFGISLYAYYRTEEEKEEERKPPVLESLPEVTK